MCNRQMRNMSIHLHRQHLWSEISDEYNQTVHLPDVRTQLYALKLCWHMRERERERERGGGGGETDRNRNTEAGRKNWAVLLLLEISAALDTIEHLIFLYRIETVFWHPLYPTPVVSITTFWQKSVRCCQQFCFLFFSSRVWYSARLSAGTRAICFAHYSTLRHHGQSLCQPSAFGRRHPTSNINSTKWCTKPCNYVQMTYKHGCATIPPPLFFTPPPPPPTMR